MVFSENFNSIEGHEVVFFGGEGKDGLMGFASRVFRGFKPESLGSPWGETLWWWRLCSEDSEGAVLAAEGSGRASSHCVNRSVRA